MAETFLHNIDVDKLKSVFESTKENVTYFEDTCREVVRQYSDSLDNLMSDLYVECVQQPDPPTSLLERYYLELSNMVYFMIDRLEQLGVYADMAKSASKEVYSKTYLAHQVKENSTGKNKTTVAELQAQSEIASQYESIVSSIYDHAYKVVKGKVSAAQDMMNTLRKILSVKTSEMELSRMQQRSS